MQYFSIKLQLTWFFKRTPFSVGIVNLKIESLIDLSRYSEKKYISNLAQHPSGEIYNTLISEKNLAIVISLEAALLFQQFFEAVILFQQFSQYLSKYLLFLCRL